MGPEVEAELSTPGASLEDPAGTRRDLLALAERVPGAWVGIKVAALLLLLDGQRPAWIARALGLTCTSLRRWVRSVNERGVESLVPRPAPGRPTALTPALRRELAAHLERSPQEFGLDGARWNGPRLVVHLKQRFGISLKLRQAQNWMHRLGSHAKGIDRDYPQARGDGAARLSAHMKDWYARGGE